MQAQVGLVIMFQKFRYELIDELKDRNIDFQVKTTLLVPRDAISTKIFQI